ncbi:hypothetical protein ZWY2020_038654 [Hordeum vulgare]|nr:hypothetical protein ZWY2020_038654 [Hordeum vulgare]
MRPSAAAAAAFLASSSRPLAAWFCSGGRGASLYAASSPLPRTRPPRLGSGSGHLKITMEEWRVVAKAIVTRKGELTHRATVVDWPGLGYSDRPSLNYNADVLENFLVQLLNSPNSPLANAGSDMKTRYGLLRGTLRAPAIGWMMYNVLSREEFLQLFAKLDGDVPVLVVSTLNSPKRSKAEMEALKGAKGVTKFVEVPGALLPQEEYPFAVAEELYDFLQGPFWSGR